MKRIIKMPAMALLKWLDLYSLYMLRRAGQLCEDGWFKSFREGCPIDRDGNPLPWITYPAIEFLKTRVHGEMSVFEYGCGFSTLWWGERVERVVSVEHDSAWYERMLNSVPGNVSLFHEPLHYGGTYAGMVARYADEFDLVVLDGRDRVNCAVNSLRALNAGGVIIWDNSNRKAYEAGFSFLHDNGFRKIEFVGYAPGIIDKTETAIFYRPGNCLGI